MAERIDVLMNSITESSEWKKQKTNRFCFIVIQESSMSWMGLWKRVKHPNWWMYKCKQILAAATAIHETTETRKSYAVCCSLCHACTMCAFFVPYFRSFLIGIKRKFIYNEPVLIHSSRLLMLRLRVRQTRMFWIYFWRLDIFISELALTGRNKHR